MPYDSVPPLKEIYSTNPIFKEDVVIGDRDEEFGLIEVGDDVTPRYPKGGGGYEDVTISKRYRRYYCVYDETSYFY